MERLKKLLLDKGAGLVGFADLEILPPRIRRYLPFGLAIAVPLDPITAIGMEYNPAGNFDADYDRVNDLLDALSGWTVRFLNEQGYIAMALPVVPPDVDQLSLSTELPHKTVATRAGLGWVGKCALLITERFGSAVRLTSVLTTAPLTPDPPVNVSRCGPCEDCRNVCPGGAPSGAEWQPGRDRDQFFNAFSCRQARAEMAQIARVKTARCGMCISVCPYTKAYVRRVYQ